MRRTLLALSCLALVLVVVLIVGASLGIAQPSQPVEDARPTPTPILPLPDKEPVAPESPEIPPLPDLIVDKIEVVPSTPLVGQVATIKVTIKNRAAIDVVPGNNFWSDLYVDPAVVPIQLGQDGVHEWPCQATWVPAGGFRVLEAPFIFDRVKSYSLWAQVDTDNHVQEANEYNNVTGPLIVQVLAVDQIVHQTHETFQLGMASSLDMSHPEGVIRPGIFVEPSNEAPIEPPPSVYNPDYPVNDHTEIFTDTGVSQVKPALASTGDGTWLFSAWEDGRHGGLFNRRIYFSRSANQAQTWADDWLLDQDPAIDPNAVSLNQVSPDLAYDAASGRLYAVWQDGRNGHYDIYFAYSTNNGLTWQPQPARKLNDDVGSANQLNPSLAVGPDQEVYVVWQDQRNGNDDVYLVRSDTLGASWSPNYFVTDDPHMRAQNQVAPSVAVEEEFGIVYVGWEDWRDPLHPEIYVMWSWDQGRTFGIDVPVTVVAPEWRTTYRIQPTLAAQTTVELVEKEDPATGTTYWVESAVSVVHVAWEDRQGGNADVYYSYASYVHDDPTTCPWPYDFCFATPQKVSGFVIDSAYVRPPGSSPAWPIEPSWQGQPSLDFVPGGLEKYETFCHADSTRVYSKGVIIAWSDARSYDDWRYEIRTRRVASPEGDAERYEVCEDWAAGMVNGNPKLHDLRDNADQYDLYQPAAAGQSNPYVVVDEAGIYVVWDDNRWDDPSAMGTVRDRDIFASRMLLPGEDRSGIYISPVIDGRSDSPLWYVLSWWGATQHTGDLRFQTRFGNSRTPPKQDVPPPGSDWTRWTGNPGSPDAVGCSAGFGCYYDAPGRPIVRPDGSDWFTNPGGPQYRYIQYKVIINGLSRLTAVSQVTIHYEGGGFELFLPAILKKH